MKKKLVEGILVILFILPLILGMVNDWIFHQNVTKLWNEYHVDMDEQIAEDANTAVCLMHASMDPEIDKDKMNQKIEKFSNRIHEYPEKRIQELDNVVTMYITYSDSLLSGKKSKKFFENIES